MRHLIGRPSAGLMADGTAGVSKPRPCARIKWGVAVSVLVHAALIAFAWQSTPARKPSKEAARLSVRLVAQAPQAAVAVRKPTAVVAPAVARRSAVRKPPTVAKAAPPRPATTATPPPQPPAVEAAAAPAETIDGSVFALPHIGSFGGTAAPRWMKTHAPSAAPAPSFVPPPAVHMHALREAGRTQLMLALQRQVSDWQAPADASDGVCSLQAQSEVQLACDNATLQQVVGAQAASLSGLLDAYRSMHPIESRLSIAYQQGRYHVFLASAAPPQ